ncbi:MAG TPA: hypothetical protein VEW28_04520 [Candidatus Kapabacteria bacterium]|nr:hypothetical protein [Candidatus Kapabacteria bacterium]
MFYRILTVAVLIISVRLDAQPLRRYSAGEITVLDSNKNVSKGIVSVTVPSAELQQISGSNLLSSVSELYPSLSVRSYGPIGAIALASFRGLPAEYISLEWNGINITNAQNNLTDLGLMDLNVIGSVTLSSSASNSGTISESGNATIGIGLPMMSPVSSSVQIGSEVTSYNNTIHAAEVTTYTRISEHITNNLTLGIAGSLTSSNGNYPFVQQGTNVSVLRENNDAHLANATINIQYVPADNIRLTGTSFYTKADRGSPAAVTIDYRGASDFNARLFDEIYLVGMTLEHSPSTDFSYTVKTAFHSSFETYDNPAKSIADRYSNRQLTFSLDGVSHSTEHIDYLTAVSFDRYTIESNEHAPPTQGSDIFRNTYRANVGMRLTEGIFQSTGYIKVEKNSDQSDPQILPQLTAKINLPGYNTTFGASYTRLYHEPTFNELYWKSGGIPDLKPESGDALELVTDVQPADRISMKAAVFYNALRDQIIWQLDSDGVWRPNELQASRTYGVELSSQAETNFGESVSAGIRIAFTYQRSENQTPNSLYFGKELPYATPLRWNIALVPRIKDVGELTLYYNYRWHRYPTYAANPSDKLPAAGVANVTFKMVPLVLISGLKLVPSCAITNLFDTQYDEIPNYPMPGREYKLGVEFTY